MQDLMDDSKLSEIIADLKEEEAVGIVSKRIELGDDPFIILDQCQRGMQLVGEKYEEGVYYISGLIIAGEIMDQISQLILPIIENGISGEDSGCIVLGTVQGDIHNIGKDMVKVLLQAYGFTVHDLGVDLPLEEVAEAVKKHKPDILGLSCLINSCYDAMKDTIALVKNDIRDGQKRPLFIIGGQVDETVRRFCDAEYWVNDAMAGVRLCQLIMKQT